MIAKRLAICSTVGLARLVEALNEPCACEPGGLRTGGGRWHCRELSREGRPLDRRWYLWGRDDRDEPERVEQTGTVRDRARKAPAVENPDKSPRTRARGFARAVMLAVMEPGGATGETLRRRGFRRRDDRLQTCSPIDGDG